MGSATLELKALDLGRSNDINLALQDTNRPEVSLGQVFLTVTLYPKSQEDKEQVIFNNYEIIDENKKKMF